MTVIGIIPQLLERKSQTRCQHQAEAFVVCQQTGRLSQIIGAKIDAARGIVE